MIRSHALPALAKHGHGIEQIKQWRTEQEEVGKPSTFEDFLRAHGLCIRCQSTGNFISGVRWQDSSGNEHSIELLAPGVPETIASIHQRELKDALRWDYTYTTCEVCGGTGKSSES
jgi:hypothetical protein